MVSALRNLAIAAAALLGAQPALAGGLYLSEFANADMGAAGAGDRVRAGDAATAGLNPAGMTYLDSHQLDLGVAPGFGYTHFDQSSDSPGIAFNNGGNQGGFVPLLGSAYVHKVSDRVRAGLAIFSLSGASLDPKADWAGRNQLKRIDLFTLTFVPTAAVRVTDWLSLGAGPLITYGRLDWKLEGPLGGGIKLKNLDDWEVAPQVGVMLQPLDALRIGFVYEGEISLHLKGRTKTASIVNPDTKVKLPLARAWRMDARWDATEDLAFSLGWAYEEWGELDTTVLDLGPINSRVHLGLKDTWKLRGGVHYWLNDEWMVQTGVSYDSSALSTRDRTAALPLDQQWRWGIGGVYRQTEDTTIAFGFEYVNLGDGNLDNAVIKGDYRDNHLFFFMLNLSFAKLPWDGRATF